MFHLLYGGTYHRKKSDTLAVRKDLITSKTKNKHWPRQLESTGEVGPSNWYFKEGDVPLI